MSTTDRRRTAAYRFLIATLRPLLMVLTKRDWRGAESFPAEGGFVVCPNHTSYFDPLAFAHFLIDNGQTPHFLGKVGVFNLPIVGWLLRKAEQIPVHRDSGKAIDAYRDAVAAIERGWTVAVYPEGTLTRDPDTWPMRGKTGAARIALATRCPVIPVAQWGPEQVIPTYGHRPRLLPRKTMQLRAGPPVDLSDLYDVPVSKAVLAEATERIMTAITVQLEAIRGGHAPAVRFDPRQHGLPETGPVGPGEIRGEVA